MTCKGRDNLESRQLYRPPEGTGVEVARYRLRKKAYAEDAGDVDRIPASESSGELDGATSAALGTTPGDHRLFL